MHTSYIYLQLYKLFDAHTPVPVDCGQLCSSACCQGDDCGMYLFPGESSVYRLLEPDWIRLEKSDFCYEYEGKKHYLPIAFCDGSCDRYQRPLACRIFPLTPVLTDEGRLDLIVDPRARSVCPLAKGFLLEDFDQTYVRNVRRAFELLNQNSQFRAFMKTYTAYINDFRRFFE